MSNSVDKICGAFMNKKRVTQCIRFLSIGRVNICIHEHGKNLQLFGLTTGFCFMCFLTKKPCPHIG